MGFIQTQINAYLYIYLLHIKSRVECVFSLRVYKSVSVLRVRICFLSQFYSYIRTNDNAAATVFAVIDAGCCCRLLFFLTLTVVEEKANNITIHICHDQCFEQWIISIILLSVINWMYKYINMCVFDKQCYRTFNAMLQNLVFFSFSVSSFYFL